MLTLLLFACSPGGSDTGQATDCEADPAACGADFCDGVDDEPGSAAFVALDDTVTDWTERVQQGGSLAIDEGGALHLCEGHFELTLRTTPDWLEIIGFGEVVVDAAGAGPVLTAVVGDSLHLDGLTLTGGVSPRGGAVQAVGLEQGAFSMSDVVVRANAADEHGGGIWVRNLDVRLADVTVDQNAAGVDGGGLWAESSTLDLVAVTLAGNEAGNNGGGLWVDEVQLVGDELVLDGNLADDEGGGARVLRSTLDLTSSSVLGNASTHRGAGISMDLGSAATWTEVVVADNSSERWGGGIWLDDASELSATGGSVTGNAATHGGGIHARHGGQASFTGTRFEANTASVAGGGLYAFEAALEVSDCELWSNAAVEGGGAFLSLSELGSSASDWGVDEHANTPDDVFTSGGSYTWGADATFSCATTCEEEAAAEQRPYSR